MQFHAQHTTSRQAPLSEIVPIRDAGQVVIAEVEFF